MGDERRLRKPSNFSSTGGLIRAASNAPLLRFRASTDIIDRHRTIVNQRGIDFSNYGGAFIWSHDSFKGMFGGAPKIENQLGKVVGKEVTEIQRPAGKGEKTESVDGLATDIDVRFSKVNPFAVMAEGMVREGILGMTSIGFIPKKDHALTIGEEVIKVFDEIELLEISLVPVPANPEAQALVRSMFGYLEKEAPADFDVQVRHSENGSWAWQDDQGWVFRAPVFDRSLAELLNVPAGIEAGIIPANVSTTKAEEGTAWSKPGLGDFTSKTWLDLTVRERRRIIGHFAWAPGSDTEEFSFSDLKLPHHRASDARVVFRGVSAAMGALLGARGGVDIPSGDRRPVYNHLAAHYRQFDRIPPEFRASSEPPPDGADTGDEAIIVTDAIRGWFDEQRALRA